MTVLLPAWLQTGSYTAEIDRSVGSALLGPSGSLGSRAGVRLVAGTEFQVTQTTTPSMNLTVAGGMAFVQGGFTSTQGVYTVVNDNPFNVTLNAANATNPRIDVVILEVLDQIYSGVSNLAQVRVLTGTPGSNPNVPTASGSYIVLAQVLVPTNATAIPNANITDRRLFTGALGAPIPVRNVTERNALVNKYNGLSVYMMDNAWEVHTYYNGEWFGSQVRLFTVPDANVVYPAQWLDYASRTVIDRIKIPDPGFRYMLHLNADYETYGGRLDGQVYCESTTTTSFSNEVASGQTMAWSSLANTTITGNPFDRLRIARWFPVSYTGNRWVTLRVTKSANEGSDIYVQFRNYKTAFQLAMHPMRPNSFQSPSVGGQP